MPQRGDEPLSRNLDSLLAERLDSWKGIAAYLRREVRTVQRWEKEEGLPVHRQAHLKLGTVYAYRRELDAWVERRRSSQNASAEKQKLRHHSRWVLAGITLLLAGAGIVITRLGRQTEPPPMVFRQITTDTGLTWQPSVSPKGDLVAYASDRASDGNLDIWIQPTSRSQPIRLTREEADDSDPSFSPDGTSLVYRSERDGGGIYLISALGSTPKLLAAGGRRPRYSPDGRWVAYWLGSRPDRFGALYVIPAEGGQPQRLTDGAFNMRSQVWAPDSKHLLLTGWSNSSRESDWYVIDRDGGQMVQTGAMKAFLAAGVVRRSRFPNMFDAYIWTSANEVVFSGESGDSTNLWKARISTRNWKIAGAPLQLTSGTGLEMHCSSSAAGDLVFSSLSQNVDIWSLPIDTNRARPTGEIHPLTRDAAEDLSPSISADGKRMVFESLRKGKRLVWKMDLETGEEAELVATPSYEALPRISADGSRVAYSIADYLKTGGESKADFYTVPFGGGQPQRICRQCGLLWDWSGSERFAFEDGRAMSVIGAASGKAHKILQETGHRFWNARFSADGRWIAFTAGFGSSPVFPGVEQRASFVAPFRPGEAAPRREWIRMPDQAGHNWSPNGAFLYYAAPLNSPVGLWVIALDPKTKRPLGDPRAVHRLRRARLSFIEDPAWRGVSVAGDKIVFALKELKGNIWTATPARSR